MCCLPCFQLIRLAKKPWSNVYRRKRNARKFRSTIRDFACWFPLHTMIAFACKHFRTKNLIFVIVCHNVWKSIQNVSFYNICARNELRFRQYSAWMFWASFRYEWDIFDSFQTTVHVLQILLLALSSRKLPRNNPLLSVS